MPRLIVTIDGVVMKELTLAKARTTLGRRPYNDVVLDHLAVSGEHAVLHMAGGEVSIEDLHSTNGTCVNAQTVGRHALRHQDLIEIGKYKIRFLARSAAGGESAAAPPPTPPRIHPEAVALSAAQSVAPTAQMPLPGQGGTAMLRVLAGAGAGREVPLKKVVTTVGKPGLAVAAVTRRLHGYVVAPVDGRALLNGELLGGDAVALQDGDTLELGGSRMQFVQA